MSLTFETSLQTTPNRGKVKIPSGLPRTSSYRMKKPVGILVHDTVTPLEGKSKWWTRIRVVNMCANGVNQGTKKKPRVIPGPLYHFLVRGSGEIVQLTGYGWKSNNAGSGDGNRLNALLKGESPLEAKLQSDSRNGNPYLYGVVLGRNGKHTMPDAMRNSLLQVLSTIFVKEDWPSGEVWRVLGHREWTKRKRDPVGVSMDELRAELNSRLQKIRKGQQIAATVKQVRTMPTPATNVYKPTAKQIRQEFNILWWWIRDWNATPALRNKTQRNKAIQTIVGAKPDGKWGEETDTAVQTWLNGNKSRK